MNAKIALLFAACVCQAYAGPLEIFMGVPKMFGQGVRNFKDIMDKGQAYGQQAQTYMQQQVYDNVKKGQDMAGAVSDRFKASVQGSMAQGDRFMKDVQNSMAEGQKFAEGLVEQMQEKFEETIKENQKMGAEIQNYFKQQFEDAEKKGKEYFDQFSKQMEAQLEDLRNQGKALGQDFEAQVAEGQATAAKIGAELQQNLKTIYEQGKQMMVQGQEVVDAIVKEMARQTAEAVEDLGKLSNAMNAEILAALKP